MPRRFLLPLALTAVYVIWGSTYLAIRVMVESIPPLLGAGLRFAVAGAIFWVWLRLRGGPGAVRVTRGQAAGAAVVGVLLLFGGNGLVTIAEQDVPSGLAALIIASVPLWVVVLRATARERVSPVTLAGVVVGFVGVALLVVPGDRPDGATLAGVLLVVVAAALWALGSFWSKRVTLPPDAFLSTSVQMLLGGGAMIAVGLAAGEAGEVRFAEIELDSALAFAYLVVAGSLVAFTSYVWLLQNAPISTVATYAYVNPVIALFLGWAILSETLTALMLAAASVIVMSVAIVVREEGGGPEAEDVGQLAVVDAERASLSASSSSKRASASSTLSPKSSRSRATR
jgi:drug/metabolite transporter (DMT)-like permease